MPTIVYDQSKTIPGPPKTPAITVPDPVTSGFAGTTHVTVVLDRSGSMLAVKDAVIAGFNLWRDKLADSARTAGGPFPVTIVLFNTTVETPVANTPIGKVNPLDESRYICRGNTALNDALVEAIHDTQGRMKSGDRALVCLVTDGQENASREYTTADVRRIITEKETEGTWTFTYLSASPSAFADAASYGVHATNVAFFVGDPQGTTSAFSRMATSTQTYATSSAMATEEFYSADEPVDVDTSAAPRGVRWLNTSHWDAAMAPPDPPSGVNANPQAGTTRRMGRKIVRE